MFPSLLATATFRTLTKRPAAAAAAAAAAGQLFVQPGVTRLFATMDFEKVKEGLEKKSITLLDVRAKEEWDAERIPGAKHLPGRIGKRINSQLF